MSERAGAAIAGAAIAGTLFLLIRCGLLARLAGAAMSRLPSSLTRGNSDRAGACLVVGLFVLLMAGGLASSLRTNGFLAGDAMGYVVAARSLARHHRLDLHGQIVSPYATPFTRNGN